MKELRNPASPNTASPQLGNAALPAQTEGSYGPAKDIDAI